MPISPPTPADAELMHRPMSSGRNKPLLLGCRTPSGELIDCVVKLSAAMEGRAPIPYLAEWCATGLAQLTGISVPQAFQVEISAEFAQSLDPPWREIALQSVGLAFGSRLREGGFSPWPTRTLVPLDLRSAAAELVAFDVWIHNPDRRADNPNALASRDEIVAIDHEMAFSFLLPLLGAPDPVEDSLPYVLAQHAFVKGLGKKVPSLDRFRNSVAAIGEADFDALVQATPPAWQSGAAIDKLAKIVDVMRRRCAAIDRWLPHVAARLQS